MKFLRTTTLFLASALLLAACNQEGDSAGASGAGNPLLAHVPVNTPYLFANIEPTPPAVIDAFMARLAPTMATAQSLLDDFELEINPGATDEQQGDEYRGARLLSALLKEFDGKLNREGLESLGLSLESHKAVYGMGIFPVVRIALKDANALRAAIGRIEAESELSFTALDLNGAAYWKIQDGNGKAGAYIAILDDHVALSVFPTAAEADWLPALLGQSLPAESLAGSGALSALNKDKEYTRYGSGYLDFQRLANEFLDPESRTLALISSTGHAVNHQLDATCTAEIRGMISRAPRLTFGTTDLTPDTVAIRYDLEVEAGLAGKMAALVADVAAASSDPDKVFSASLGLNMGRVRDFVMEQANAIVAEPFQCARLQQLNEQAQMLLTQMNQPMPPFINNLKGFRLSLDEVDFEQFKPENTRGMFSLEVEKPQMLIGMAQMFVPGVDDLQLEPGAEPVELPRELMSFAAGDLRVFAAMGDRSIGFAVGGDRQAELAAFMDADGGNEGVVFSMEYDMSAPLEFQRRMQEVAYAGDGEAIPDMIEQLRQSYLNWLGRSRMEVSLTGDGIQIDTKMTFR